MKNEIAVSEIFGSMLLLGVAVVTAIAIYSFILPVPIPTAGVSVHISAYDTGDSIIFQHEGGVSIDTIKIDVVGHTTNNTITYFFYDVEIGDRVVIPNNSENKSVFIYCNNQIIFEGDFIDG